MLDYLRNFGGGDPPAPATASLNADAVPFIPPAPAPPTPTLQAHAVVAPTPAAGGTSSATVEARWQSGLPSTLQRAACEIYTSLRVQGAASVREWLNLCVGQQKAGKDWAELWTIAVQVDFLVAEARSSEEVASLLKSSDVAEIGLRRLASWSYVRRTGDVVGGQRLLAVLPPGVTQDIAPTWMIQDATIFSKGEYQRQERVSKSNAHANSGGGGGHDTGDGGGRGGGFRQRRQTDESTAPPAASGGRGVGGRGRGGGRGGRGRARGQH